MSDFIDFSLWMRFLVGYPAMAACGFVLAAVSLGRMRRMHDSRRQLYLALAGVAAGLAWCGVWGVMGIWQYGTLVTGAPVNRQVVSVAFSWGIFWVAIWLVTVVICIIREEWLIERTKSKSSSSTLQPGGNSR